MTVFEWTDEQHALRSSVRALVERHAPLRSAREPNPAVWKELGRAGLIGLALPEDVGGGGAGLVELAIVGEELGRVLLGGPYLSSAVLAAHAVPSILDGERTATLAVVEEDGRWSADSIRTTVSGDRITGVKPVVLDGADADVLLVAAREGLFAVEGTEGVTRTPLTALDLTRPVARIAFDAAPARRVGGWDAVERALRAGRVYLAAEQVGGAARAVEITAEYARTRHQFGRAIGSFQAVKHRLSAMAVRTELARSTAYYAAWSTVDDTVAIAGAYCAEAFLRTAEDMVQLHGGIGFTWEHDAHLFVRRARSTHSLLGSPAQHRAGLLGALTAEAAG